MPRRGNGQVVLEVSDPAGLDAVGPYIHDCWFDVEEFERASDGLVLSIPYARRGSRAEPARGRWRLRPAKAPLFRWWLRFDGVRDVHLVDTDELGSYDFNELVYDPASSRIRVLTNIPLEVEVEVEKVHVSVERSDLIVSER